MTTRPRPLPAAALAAALLAPPATAGTVTATWIPELVLDQDDAPILVDSFGDDVCGVGDLDGDGTGDIAVLVTSPSPFAAGLVFSGADGRHLLTVSGGSSFSFPTSWPLRGAGDVDGDGVPDVVIGSAFTEHARVVSGATGETLHVLTEATLAACGEDPAPPVTSGGGFGAAVSGAGDVNGDGHADVVVGERDNGDDTAARVISGADGCVVHTFTYADEHGGIGLGSAVRNAGDVDGDGVEDVIVGAHRDGPTYVNPGIPFLGIPPFVVRHPNGGVRVYSGATGDELHHFLARDEVVDPDFRDGFGDSVSGAGDVNGDGHADLVVGTFGVEAMYPGGFARVYDGLTGAEIVTLLDDDDAWDTLVVVDALGDVNGDGRDDVLVASRAQTSGPGGGVRYVVRVFASPPPGETDGPVDEWPILFEHEHDCPGFQCTLRASSAGDVNGDGVQDIVIGAWWHIAGYGDAVLLVSRAIAGPADVDGDGAGGVTDLLAILAAWGPCPDPPDACPADLDGDGDVGTTDLLLVLAGWGV